MSQFVAGARAPKRGFVVAALMAATVQGLAACGGSAAPGERRGLTSIPKGQEIPCELHSDPRLAEMSDAGVGLASELGLAPGRYALPANKAPTQLVVMFHGHGNDSCSWRRHLQNVAALGAVAVAMDYSGQAQTPIENYGWCVRAGAADSIAAARYFLNRYPSIQKVYAFSISMGANVAGYALYSPLAQRADGSPLFDHWVAAEGVHNLAEQYLIARAVAPVIADGAIAQKEIETENGGSLEQAPQAYTEISNVLHAQELAYLKSAVLIHGIDDGLVPTTQSREMFVGLTLAGVPTHLYTVGATGVGEAGTTATSIVLGPLAGAAGQTYESPLAGHGWEGSETHLVIRTALDQLYALLGGATVSIGETPVPGL